MEEKIKQGIENLFEKRLKNLEIAMDNNPSIYEEVDLCIDVERLAIQEGFELDEYVNRRRQLINGYNQRKIMEYKQQ